MQGLDFSSVEEADSLTASFGIVHWLTLFGSSAPAKVGGHGKKRVADTYYKLKLGSIWEIIWCIYKFLCVYIHIYTHTKKKLNNSEEYFQRCGDTSFIVLICTWQTSPSRQVWNWPTQLHSFVFLPALNPWPDIPRHSDALLRQKAGGFAARLFQPGIPNPWRGLCHHHRWAELEAAWLISVSLQARHSLGLTTLLEGVLCV